VIKKLSVLEDIHLSIELTIFHLHLTFL